MEPFGTAIFCDDVRFELQNKMSLIGTYGSELILFGSFPATLPKLGILSSVRFSKAQRVRGGKILIYLPGDSVDSPSHTHDLSIDLRPEEFPNPDPSDYPDFPGIYGFNHPLLVSPVVIRQSGYIRVRGEFEGTTIKIGALRIREATPGEAAGGTGKKS
jgi:hypothetical protein